MSKTVKKLDKCGDKQPLQEKMAKTKTKAQEPVEKMCKSCGCTCSLSKALPSMEGYQSLAQNPVGPKPGAARPANPANNKPKLPTGAATATQANNEIKNFESLVKPKGLAGAFKSPITGKLHAKTGAGTFQDS